MWHDPIAAPESREVLAEIARLVYACGLVHVSSDCAAALERPAAPSAPYPRAPGVSTLLPKQQAVDWTVRLLTVQPRGQARREAGALKEARDASRVEHGRDPLPARLVENGSMIV